MAQRVVRIFFSTPSDVDEERRALAALISEINDVVTFLAPERNVRLELVHYQTHAYPDVGSPQQVIDRLIPVDYDVHFGVMWKRCGTPTKTADSGTVHEFDRALAHREKTGRPIIMFYFGMEDVGMPTTREDIEQLSNVIKFRERLQTIGLTATYPKRAEFRERARIGLLRAVADILREELPVAAPQEAIDEPTKIPDDVQRLCEQYDATRVEKRSGPERTRRMTALFEEMKIQAPFAQASLRRLKAEKSAGCRLAAIAILQIFPSPGDLGWLADRLDPEKELPFVGFQAAIALLQAARSLPKSDCQILGTEVERALDLAKRNRNDPPRIDALNYALRELRLKCG